MALGMRPRLAGLHQDRGRWRRRRRRGALQRFVGGELGVALPAWRGATKRIVNGLNGTNLAASMAAWCLFACMVKPREAGALLRLALALSGFVVAPGVRAASGSSAPVDPPFLPAGATVVLVAGLPGDLESETRYRREMQGWLDWLGGQSPPPQRVIVLGDSAEPSSVAFPFRFQSSPATRDNWLALGGDLAGVSNVVAIVWGHGGQQGSAPVFHVRGPRITPADLVAVGDRLSATPAMPSRWLLFFRGSGRFAAALAGPSRLLLSSDHDLAFRSDPQCLPLLQQVLAARSATSFVAVAGELGRAVTGWYETRQLARTEEPTLWRMGEAPRRLAGSGKHPRRWRRVTALRPGPRRRARRQRWKRPRGGERGRRFPDRQTRRRARSRLAKRWRSSGNFRPRGKTSFGSIRRATRSRMRWCSGDGFTSP